MNNPEIRRVFEMLGLTEAAHRAALMAEEQADEAGYTRAIFTSAESTSAPMESEIAQLERAAQRAERSR